MNRNDFFYKNCELHLCIPENLIRPITCWITHSVRIPNARSHSSRGIRPGISPVLRDGDQVTLVHLQHVEWSSYDGRDTHRRYRGPQEPLGYRNLGHRH